MSVNVHSPVRGGETHGALVTLGRALAVAGEFAEAAKLARRTLEFDPGNDDARDLLERIRGVAGPSVGG